MRKYVNVKTYKRSIGRNCLHCSRGATTVATRLKRSPTADRPPMRLTVWYCDEHHAQLINGVTP